MVPIQKLGEGNKLAILFPGMGYNLDKPVLWYSKSLLVELGWQIWGVAYNHRQSGDNLEHLLEAEVAEVLAEASGQFAEYLLVGKSLGTLAMHFAYQHQSFSARGIWLTPLMLNIKVRETLLNTPGGLVVYGTQDPAADLAMTDTLAARHQVLAVPGADHSLQVAHTEQTIAIMGSYIASLRNYLDQ